MLVLLAIVLLVVAAMAVQRARMRAHQTPGYTQGK
jgi:hypothetical protein